jgi:iron complex outermembrane recepter protein
MTRGDRCFQLVVRLCGAVFVASALAASPSAAQEAKPTPTPTPTPAAGQAVEAETPRFAEEVTVTANRREENVQTVPAAVSAVEGATLEAKAATGMEDYLPTEPGVQFSKTEPQRATISLRGISTDSYGTTITQRPVGMYVDEIPFTDYFMFMSAPDLAPFDLERVEVLRGPQGTLYGSASLGGAIRYITRKPNLDTSQGALNLTASSTADGGTNFQAQAMFNAVAARGTFALRGVVAYNQDAGYVDNPTIATKDWNSYDQPSGRLLATWAPSDRVKLDASYIYQKTNMDGTGLVEGPDFDNPVQSSWRLYEGPTKYELANVTASFDLGFGDLKSITSNARKSVDLASELGAAYTLDTVTGIEALLKYVMGVPVNFGDLSSQVTQMFSKGPQESEAWTQEFRLVSRAQGRFDWLAGAFYTKQDNDQAGGAITLPGIESAVNGVAPGLGSALFPADAYYLQSGGQSAKEWAVYGELGVALTDKLRLTAGGRYFDYESESRMDFTVFGGALTTGDVPVSQTGFMPKVSLGYQADESTLYYGVISRGYRVGGVNLSALLTAPDSGIPTTYGSDNLWNYEIGLKHAWSGGRLVTNVSAFYLDWTDIQLTGTFKADIAVGQVFGVLNTGKAHSAGIEALAVAQLAPGLNLRAALAWTDAVLDEDSPEMMDLETKQTIVAPKGTHLPGTPEWQTSTSLEYYWNNPGLGYPFVSLTHNYKGWVLDGITTLEKLSCYNLWDFRVGATIVAGLDVSLGVRNLLDERAPMTRSPMVPGQFVPVALPEMFFITVPRTYMITFQKKF